MTAITRRQLIQIIECANGLVTALAGTNDDIHPDNSEKMCGLWDDLNDRYAPPEVVQELARTMLASMDAEPAVKPYFYTSPPVPDNKQTDELVMWVKRLAHSLRNARPDSRLHGAAMDYLSRKGLISVEDVLR
ncbi:TPA: hypothetical protein ACIA70_002924 [Salmonella enterica subsp. enterica serovar Java]